MIEFPELSSLYDELASLNQPLMIGGPQSLVDAMIYERKLKIMKIEREIRQRYPRIKYFIQDGAGVVRGYTLPTQFCKEL